MKSIFFLVLLLAGLVRADTSQLALKSSGWVASDGRSGGPTAWVGAVDNTWPSSDDYHRAYFWWNSNLPAGVAIEEVVIDSLGYRRQDYADGDWFALRAGKIGVGFAAWGGQNNGTRYGTLGSAGDARTYLNWTANPGNPASETNIVVAETDYDDVKAGNFGVGFNFNDTTGGVGDDSTFSEATAGNLTVTHWSMPGLSTPAEGVEIQSGTATLFSWGGAMPTYDKLRFRLQASRQSDFSVLDFNQLVSATQVTLTPAEPGTWYWRLRIESQTDSSNVSSWSAARSFSVTVPPVPGVVQGLSATDGLSPNYVRLTWQAVNVASSYEIYRNTVDDAQSASLLASSSAADFLDGSAAPGVTYFYWVRAKNSSGTADFSQGDFGYRSAGGTATVPVAAQGYIWWDHDGDFGQGADPLFGWVDNTFPVDDDHYIAWHWWDGGGSSRINWALEGGASATQSSDHSAQGPASNAIDGNRDGNWLNGSVTHTSGNEPGWWEVDLGTGRGIAQVVLYNRSDCCGQRLSNFRVSVLDAAGNEVAGEDFYPVAGSVPQGGSEVWTLPGVAFGQRVRVALLGPNRDNNSILSLAEVEVLGPVLPGAAAVESAALTSVRFTKTNYQDSDWSEPRVGVIPTTRADFDSNSGSQARWNRLSGIYSSGPHLLQLNADPQVNPYETFDIPLFREDLPKLINGNQFGMAVDITDKTGDPSDDSTQMRSTMGPLEVAYYEAPQLTEPVDGAGFQSGTVTVLGWNGTNVFSPYLRHRLQVAADPAFSQLIINELLTQTSRDLSLVDGGDYYWRVRIEDKDQPGNATAWSAVRSYSVTAPTSPPPMVSGVTASDGLFIDRVLVGWQPVELATSYEILRAASDQIADAQVIGSSSIENYEDGPAVAGQTYFYWVRALNQAGAGPVSRAESGYRSPDFGNTVSLNPILSGAVEDDTVAGFANISPTRFGLDDGTFWNARYRAFIWWPTGNIPADVAIDSAAFSSLGYDPEEFPTSREKTARAIPIAASYTQFANAGPETRFGYLDTALDAGNAIYRHKTSNGFSHRASNVELPRQLLSSLADDNFGLAFGSDEDDVANIEDLHLLQALGGSLTVRYYGTPALTGPAAGAVFNSGDGVEIEWQPVLYFGEGTFLRYRLQLSSDPSFTSGLFYNALTQFNRIPFESLPDATSFHWRVRIEDAANPDNASAWSPVRSFTIPLPLPQAPSDVIASDGTRADAVALTWSPSIKAAEYLVYRNTSEDFGGAQLLTQTSEVSYLDSSAMADQAYFYWVVSRNATGDSAASVSDRGFRGLDAPASVNATHGSGSVITLGWSAVADAATYQIWRSTIDDPGALPQPLMTTPGTNFIDASVASGQNYYYWVKARNSVAVSPFSQSTTGSVGLAPPLALVAGDGDDLATVGLSWSPSPLAESYEVLRAGSPAFAAAQSLGTVSVTAFSDTTAQADTEYFYWVRALAGGEISMPSAPDRGYLGIAAPEQLTAADGLLPGEVNLTWSAVPGAAKYLVFRADESGGLAGAAALAEVPAGTLTFADQGASAGALHHYAVVAVDSVATSQQTTDTGFLAPSGLSASDGLHQDKVVVTWQASHGAANYEVFRATVGDVGQAVSLGVTSDTTFEDLSASRGQLFYYWVKSDFPGTGFSNSDSGNTGTGTEVILPLLGSGTVRNASEQFSDTLVGWTDNTWPASDDHDRAWFYWDLGGMPAGVAVESARIEKLGYQKVNYADSDWSNPTARLLSISSADFLASGAGGRWNALNPDPASATYYASLFDAGAQNLVENVRVKPDHLGKLKPGGSFGIAYTSDDTTGGAGDDSTVVRAQGGPMTVLCYGAPAVVSPAPGASLDSGDPVKLVWTPVFPKNRVLHYRLQVADSPTFSNLLVNFVTNENEYDLGQVVGDNKSFYWRVRVEDKSMEPLAVSELNEPQYNFSAWSGAADFNVLPPTAAPLAVAALFASEGSFENSVRLLWERSGLAEFYDIYRGTTDSFGSASLLVTLPGSESRYLDTSATPGIDYHYWIIARNSLGSSPVSSPASGRRGAATGDNYFPQSVASGSPRPDSIVLWTRVYDSDFPTDDHSVRLEMASDQAFANIVYSNGNLSARSAHDHCVKHQVTGLLPYTTYYYRFRYLKPGDPAAHYSRTGRTRTAPLPDQDVTIRFGYLSCQDYIGKYYNTLHDMVCRHAETLDFVMWVGDYVYETTGNPEFQATGSERGMEFADTAGAINLGGYYGARSLSNYRTMYKTYRGDPALQRVHELFPMIVTWDDHEYSDDNHAGAVASYFDERFDEYDPVRKRNSEQAFIEYLPTEIGLDSVGVAVDESILFPNNPPIYGSWKFGSNCEVMLSDYRSYRPDHLIPESAFPGEIIMTEAEVRGALKGLYGWDDNTLNANWSAYQGKLDPYDPNFDADGTFGLAIQAGVIFFYQEQGLSYAESVAYAKQAVKSGRMSATLVNFIIDFAGIGVGKYSQSELDSFPRGISYAFCAHALPFSPIGSRYAVIRENFNLYAYHRYLETGGATENVYGDAQTQWLNDTLSASTANWKLFVNSTSFTPMLIDIPLLRSWVDIQIPSIVPDYLYPLLENEVAFNADAWDGFPNKRREILDLLSDYNAVALAGDIHSTWVTRHRRPNGRIVPEFTGTSVSSGTVDGLFTEVLEGYPEIASVADPEDIKPLLKPLFIQSAPKADIDSEILDCELGSNGYIVVECSRDRMRVLRHEIPFNFVGENYYDEGLKDRLNDLVTVIEHRVTRVADPLTGRTECLEMGQGIEQEVGEYNRFPRISEGESLTVNLSQNNSPDPFALTLNAFDEDLDPLAWQIVSAPAHGEAQVTGAGLSAVVSYTPNEDFQGYDSFEVEVSDGKGGSDRIIVYANIEASSSWDLWRWHYLSPIDANTNNQLVWSATADPDEDGRNNLGEFGLGRRPDTPDPAGIEQDMVDGQDGARHLTITFVRRKQASTPNLVYRIEESSTLHSNSWTEVAPANITEVGPPVEIDADHEQVTLRLESDLSDSGQHFLRVKMMLAQ